MVEHRNYLIEFKRQVSQEYFRRDIARPREAPP